MEFGLENAVKTRDRPEAAGSQHQEPRTNINTLRRSERPNFGVPPVRYGYPPIDFSKLPPPPPLTRKPSSVKSYKSTSSVSSSVQRKLDELDLKFAREKAERERKAAEEEQKRQEILEQLSFNLERSKILEQACNSQDVSEDEAESQELEPRSDLVFKSQMDYNQSQIHENINCGTQNPVPVRSNEIQDTFHRHPGIDYENWKLYGPNYNFPNSLRANGIGQSSYQQQNTSFQQTETENEDVGKLKREDSPPPPSEAGSNHSSVVEVLEKMTEALVKAKVPRKPRDLPLFSGDPMEWPLFISQYHMTTKTDKVTDADNIYRLQKCLKGKAKETVHSMLLVPDNLDMVIKTLELNFGRPDLVIQTLTKKAREIPQCKFGKPEMIVDMANKVRNLVTTMVHLKCEDYLMNPELKLELERKLPDFYLNSWYEYCGITEKKINLQIFADWLVKRAENAVHGIPLSEYKSSEVKAHGQGQQSENKSFQKHRDKYKKEIVLTTDSQQQRPTSSSNSKFNCYGCGQQGHGIHKCQKFLDMDLKLKWDVVKINKLCISCLQNGHMLKDCKIKRKCKINGCQEFHNSSLHKEKQNPPLPKEETEVSLVTQKVIGVGKSVLLKMVPVTLKGPKGNYKTFALLDDASSCTLIDEAIANLIGADGPEESLILNWTDNVKRIQDKSRSVSCQVIGLRGSTPYSLTNVRTVQKLILPVQSVNMSIVKNKWKHLKNINLPSYSASRPTILIGEDHGDLIVSREVVEGNANEPIASKTKLGWTLHGPMELKSSATNEFTYVIQNSERNCSSIVELPEDINNEFLHELIKENWKVEAFGVKVLKELPKSKDEEKAKELMKKYSHMVPEVLPLKGERWMTRLLWRNEDAVLPESKSMAMSRLKNVERKMDRDPSYASQYCAKIQEYVDKGYAKKLSSEESSSSSSKTWYLPHFGVTNPNKPGKIRLVFDAAAKSHGSCLNDYLLPGPDLLNPLPVVLFKFRQKAIGFTADIKEMFHQVLVDPVDFDAQRFLWRGMARDRPPDTYVMPVTIFGSVAAPYTAAEIKNMNATRFSTQYPEAVDAIINRHYVDDYLDSAASEEDAIKLINDVIMIHKAGGFIICNWSCSSKKVLSKIPEDLRTEDKKDMNLSSDLPMERVLGLHWDPNTDNFTFSFNFPKLKGEIVTGVMIPTKRDSLKLVMSVFDPLGYLAHFIIKAKVLLQDIWRSGIGWDEKLTEELMERWKSWIEELKSITQVQIPRWYRLDFNNECSIQLHVFCDASEKGYAAVAYWRIQRGDNVATAFIMAKTRVSPLKPLSIPRLELQGAVMASRLAKFVSESHDVIVKKTCFWTDSKTVLCWLRSDARKYKPFVAHRVGEILETTNLEDWRWVPTNENVADEATRIKEKSNMKPNSRWFVGPDFLMSPEESWPAEISSTSKAEICTKEMKGEFLFVTNTSRNFEKFIDVTRFSSFMRLLRTVAWILRFKNNFLKKLNAHGELTVQEMETAENQLLRQVQAEDFQDEIKNLVTSQTVSKSSRLFNLNPYLDKEGLIRLGGRLGTNQEIGISNPIILDPKNYVSKLIIMHYHKLAGHNGQERVCNDVRQKYWILNLRTAVKSSWNSCRICKLRRAAPINPQMGSIPDFRIASFQRPFTVTGLDYFGPMDVTIGRRREKRYGALFTCLTTRAVHMELAASLSTDSALMAIRRFISRRGNPKAIYSDNGTNFHGVDNEIKKSLKELNQEKLKTEMSSRGIEWHFIPPSAPHMGGAWERLVRSIKTALKATLKERSPHEEVLHTFLLEAENSVNGRPLTHVSVDAADPESITPNHFLIGASNNQQSPGVFTNTDLCLRKQWRIAQRLADMFWHRWVKEYLPTLTRRQKWFQHRDNVKDGDLVFIADGNLERNSWPRGIVIKTYPGKDGTVRVVDVKTVDGVYRRPIVKICKIDVSTDVVDGSHDASTGGGMYEAPSSNPV